MQLLRGRAVWTEMEKKNLIPGRTWQSMKGHFIKILQDEDKLDKFGCSVEQLKEADKEIYRLDDTEEEGDQENGEGVDKKRKSKAYSVEEDKKVRWVCL